MSRILAIISAIVVAGALFVSYTALKKNQEQGFEQIIEEIGGNKTEYVVRLEGNVKINRGAVLNIYIVDSEGEIKGQGSATGELVDTLTGQIILIDTISIDTL